MTPASNTLEESALTLAWSMWAELGVPGVIRNHAGCSIDPEALLLLTAALAATDPRLRDESLDCLHNLIPYVWTSRLKVLLRTATPHVRECFEKYAATFNASSKSSTRLPQEKKVAPWRFQRTHKSRELRFDSQGLMYLRTRALLGVGVKADAMVTLLCKPHSGWLASELSQSLGTAKRVVSNVLLDFEQAGAIQSVKEANRLRYQLAKERDMTALLGPLPARHPAWGKIVSFITTIANIGGQRTRTADVVLRVDASAAIEELAAALFAEGIVVTPPQSSQLPDLLSWAEHHVAEIAQGGSSLLGSARQSDSDKDSLTGLRNKRRIISDLTSAMSRPSPLGLALVDLRRFKDLNDKFGHTVGDIVLKRVADVLAPQLLAGRIGGDEFAIILEGDALKDPEQWSRTLAASIEERCGKDLSSHPIRVWIGVAVKNATTVASPYEMLTAADKALMSSKNSKHAFSMSHL